MRERGRTRRLFGLGARTGGALLKTRLGGQADWQALGEALFEGLSELKGPAMKLAQIMSQWDDLLPPELANEDHPPTDARERTPCSQHRHRTRFRQCSST